MRMLLLFKFPGFIRYAVALILMGCALSASAYEKTIEAVYTPDPNSLRNTAFVIVTPGEGKCTSPSSCNGALGMMLPVVFESPAGIEVAANANDPRQGAYFKIPLGWRSVMLINGGCRI